MKKLLVLLATTALYMASTVEAKVTLSDALTFTNSTLSGNVFLNYQNNFISPRYLDAAKNNTQLSTTATDLGKKYGDLNIANSTAINALNKMHNDDDCTSTVKAVYTNLIAAQTAVNNFMTAFNKITQANMTTTLTNIKTNASKYLSAKIDFAVKEAKRIHMDA